MNILTLFDIDNTLIQSSAGHRQAYTEAVKEVYDLEVDINVINHHGMTDQEILLKVLIRKIFLLGDTPKDMKAGKAVGATTIGVTTGIFSDEQLEPAGADIVFSNLADTDSILKFIL
ncbi:MAG: HAD family hydrolase [Desulfobacterales bacterium]|nr:MAG: HAD family hydrolase [Desulfobacterales bacterium]